jgi:hypothetical protein
MKNHALVVAAAVSTGLLGAPVAQIADRKELVRRCVESRVAEYRQSGAITVSAKGRVECPAASVSGFPPKVKKHDRSGAIVATAGEGRVICPDISPPRIVNVSDNDGWHRDFVYNDAKTQVTLPIGCRGSGLSQGRGWFGAEVQVSSCPIVSERVILDFTLICAEALTR